MVPRIPALHRNPWRRAFTLLELLVVLAILAMFAALAIPRLRTVVGRSQLQLAAQQLVQDLTLARLYAIEHGVTYVVQRDAQGLRYVVRPQFMPQSAAIGPTASVGSRHTLPSPSRSRTDTGTAAVFSRRPPVIEHEFDRGIAFQQIGMSSSDQADSGLRVDTESSQLGRKLAAGQTRNVFAESRGQRLGEAGNVASTGATPSNSWTRVARFFPDGRAEASSIMLHSKDGYRMELTVRRLTGGVQIGGVERQTEFPAEIGTDVRSQDPSIPHSTVSR